VPDRAWPSWLTEQGHDIFSVFDAARGISDREVLPRAVSERRILVTTDKDFGEMIFRQGRMHTGVIAGAYVVATEETIRIRSG
jgi:predicted nuclease of predicted toxin-antitoxin system